MRRYVLIGERIAHSQSPLLHALMFEAMGVTASYGLTEVAEIGIKDFCETAKKELDGFNVTMPHKLAILPHLDGLSERAKKVGAVNTVSVKDGKLFGDTTDGEGLLRALDAEGFAYRGKEVLLLGAGGAARSAAFSLHEAGAIVSVYNRTKERAEALKEEFGLLGRVLDEPCPNFPLIINCTALGKAPLEKESVFEDGVLCGADVYDMVYFPRTTRLMKQALAGGGRAANGLSMLFYQGVVAEQRWGFPVEEVRVREVFNLFLERQEEGK